jgi:hypothetical protein
MIHYIKYINVVQDGNKQKSEGKYREALENKIMFHSKKINFWKDKWTRKRNEEMTKNFDRLATTRHYENKNIILELVVKLT